MSLNRMKFFWVAAVLSGLIFGALLAVRNGAFDARPPRRLPEAAPSSGNLSDRNTWKNIYQNGNKIGVSHATFAKTQNGYRLHETLSLRINTMGMVQNISLETNGRLNPDFSLAAFDFAINSGRFRFSATGSVSGRNLSVTTLSAGDARTFDIPLENKIYLTAGLLDAVTAARLNPSDVLSVDIFDPASMSQQAVDITVIGDENITIMGSLHPARKVTLNFKGVIQTAWIGESGEILKEKGLMGISLEKTSRDDALFGLPLKSSEDLTQVASIAANIRIDAPEALDRLQVEIGNISLAAVQLDGGRQRLENHVLTVVKESLDGLDTAGDAKPSAVDAGFLAPSVFIQSDHPKITALVAKTVKPDDPPVVKARKLLDWIYANIEKRPVLSLPDALSTLENRMGDCNEHSMLLAAMARAAGIPAKVEAGLVYLNGRFYYHAWNSLYVGRWITADSLFGQLPADVTHLRFSSGIQRIELDIMNVIGRLELKIVPPAQAYRK